MNVIYFVLNKATGLIKIGTTKRLGVRLVALRRSDGKDLVVNGVMDGSHSDERAIHKRFSHLRVKGEWFRADPELLLYIDMNTSEWSGRDPDTPVHLHPNVVHRCTIAAAYKGMTLSEYISQTLGPIAKRDADEGAARYLERKSSKPAK